MALAECRDNSLPKLLVREGTASPIQHLLPFDLPGQKERNKESPLSHSSVIQKCSTKQSSSPHQVRTSHDKLPKFTDSFSWTVSRDLPAVYRAIEEDNKVLCEALKKLKQRATDQEAKMSSQNKQLVALQDENAQLQQALKECSVSPESLLHHQQFNKELQQRDRQVQHLNEKVRILEKARDSQERKHRAELLSQRKQCEAREQEVVHMKEVLADKDRQERMISLHMRTLYQRLEVLEAGMRLVQQQPLPAASPALPSPPPPEDQVQLMLCYVYDVQPPSGAELRERVRLLAIEDAYEELVAQQQGKAALVIQMHYKAFKARRLLQKHRQAAVKIQAHIRGMLARQTVATLRARACAEAHGGRRGDRRSSGLRHSLRTRRKGFAALDTSDFERPRRMSGAAGLAGKAQASLERPTVRGQSSVLSLTESAQAKRVSIVGTTSPQRADSSQSMRSMNTAVPRLALANSPSFKF